MNQLPIDIERYYLSEYGRQAVLVPSGRFGIYAIIRSVFSPGDKIIISPLTCRTVVLALFSSGVIPVFVDVDENTGNIDVEKLTSKQLSCIKGIITTNLYGTPDRTNELGMVCKKHGLFLLEDCAQVVDARIEGMRVGTFGDAAVFSFSKFLNAAYGGVVLSDDQNLLKNVRRVVESESRKVSLTKSFSDRLKSGIVHGLPGGGKIKEHIKSGLSKLQSVLPIHDTGGVRQPLTYAGVGPLNVASLKTLHKYLSYSGKPYDLLPSGTILDKARLGFRSIDEMVNLKRKMNENLIQLCPLELKKARYDAEYCNFLVPYFSDKRDEIIERLAAEKSIDVWYIYNPPLSDVFDANTFVNVQRNPEIAREWGRRVLPINSKYMNEYMEIIRMTDKKSSRVHIECKAAQCSEEVDITRY